MRFPSARLRWNISSRFYRYSYIGLARQLDDELFEFLGSRVEGGVVVDCGCGPGLVTECFVKRGAGQVIAIDENPAMLRQTRSRLTAAIDSGQVTLVHSDFYDWFTSNLHQRFQLGDAFDVILFKRSLYLTRQRALRLIQTAATYLKPNGVLAVVHPDRSLLRYAFGPGLRLMPYTPFHLFNRVVSQLGARLRIGEYSLYTPPELLGLAREAANGREVDKIPSGQRAYNLVAIVN